VIFTGLGGSQDETWQLDAVRKTWVQCENMVHGRSGHGMVSMSGNVELLYVVGGYIYDEDTTLTRALASVDEYDVITDRWATIGSLTIPVYGMGCVGYGSTILVMGGMDQQRNTINSIQLFCVITGQCSVVSNLPQPDFMTTSVLAFPHVVNIGRTGCYIYDLKENKCTRRALASDVCCALVIYKTKLYCFSEGKVGGTVPDGIKSIALQTLIEADEKTVLTWNHEGNLPYSAIIFGHAAIDAPMATVIND
jgi:hypothetical protein